MVVIPMAALCWLRRGYKAFTRRLHGSYMPVTRVPSRSTRSHACVHTCAAQEMVNKQKTVRRMVAQAIDNKDYGADALAASSIVAKMTSKGRRFNSSSKLTARKQAYTLWRRMADALSLNTDFAREVTIMIM